MATLMLFGDTHGKNESYLATRKTHWRSVHLGDMGAGFVKLHRPNPKHLWIPGNHDNPAIANSRKDCLGYHGFTGEFFFVGGAKSIDQAERLAGLDWWPDEEMSEQEMDKCFYLYVKTKPKLVLSHDCPLEVTTFSGVTRTNLLLQAMFDQHKPERWYFGHHHVTQAYELGGTKFQCVGKMEHMVIEI